MNPDRIHGCLLGGAVGDALGAPLEFERLEQIRQRYGPAGLTDPGWDGPGTAEVTDDTQMTLFALEGLIRSHGRDRDVVVAEVHLAHLRWYLTQTTAAPANAPVSVGAAVVGPDEGLASQPWLYAARAPGKACMRGLATGRLGTLDDPNNPNSKGCGTVMRSAPFGLVPAWSPDEAFDVAAACSAYTHGHPTGYLAAGAFAAITRRLLDGSDLGDAVDGALALLGERPHHEETTAALRSAQRAAEEATTAATTVEALGEGWVAEEALAIAVYAALAHPDDARAALLLAVNHSGDSDSTGAIAGNLVGTRLGSAALPQEWVAAVEGRATIENLADTALRTFG